MIAQTLLVLRQTRSGVALGALTACQFAPILFLGAWAGAVADRSDKRRLLIVTQTLAMGQSVALGIAAATHHATIPVVFALAGVQGVLTAFDNPSRRSFVVEMVPPDQLPNAVSLNSAVMTGSRVVGPALAGVLIVSVGFAWCFFIDAASYLAVLWGLWHMRTAELFAAPPTARAKGQVRDGLRYIRSERRLVVPLVMTAIIGMFAFNFSVTVPLLVKGPLHGGDRTFTLLFSVLSAGSLVGALSTARRKLVTDRQLVTAGAGFGLSMLALAAAPGVAGAFVVAVVLGFYSIAFFTASTAIVQLGAGPVYRGRVMAIQSMVFLGTTPIGGPLIGWISDVGGPRAGIAVGGVPRRRGLRHPRAARPQRAHRRRARPHCNLKRRQRGVSTTFRASVSAARANTS
jgi:MFS family permease